MTREIALDFNSLQDFIGAYNLAGLVQAEYVAQLKPMHKKLFALMTITAEIEHNNKQNKLFPALSEMYLKESVSDIGQSLFCWVHGAYKPANLILRSGIETFIKAIASQEIPEIVNEKSMYAVFDSARNTSFFSSELGKYYFAKIHQSYKRLCGIVHTAGPSNMANISALKAFPVFSKANATSVCQDVVTILTAIISIMYVCFYKFIPKMHPKNQLNFLSSIPRSTKKKICDGLG